VDAEVATERKNKGAALPNGLNDGPAWLIATADGYEPHEQKMLILGALQKDEAVEKVFLRKSMADGTASATLRWGSRPRDLDLHCVSSTGSHVYYSHKREGEIDLDIDVTNSFGPETLTIKPVKSRAYKLYVHNYTTHGRGEDADDDIARSGATIEMRVKSRDEKEQTQLVTLKVPNNPVTDLAYWELCTIYVDKDGHCTVQVANKLQGAEPPKPSAAAPTTAKTAAKTAAKKA